jgi:hypothetical protein
MVAALRQVSPMQRAALMLRELLEWDKEQVATVLNTTVGAVQEAQDSVRATLGDSIVASRNLESAWEQARGTRTVVAVGEQSAADTLWKAHLADEIVLALGLDRLSD